MREALEGRPTSNKSPISDAGTHGQACAHMHIDIHAFKYTHLRNHPRRRALPLAHTHATSTTRPLTHIRIPLFCQRRHSFSRVPLFFCLAKPCVTTTTSKTTTTTANNNNNKNNSSRLLFMNSLVYFICCLSSNSSPSSSSSACVLVFCVLIVCIIFEIFKKRKAIFL